VRRPDQRDTELRARAGHPLEGHNAAAKISAPRATRDVGEPKFATRQEHVKTMHNPPL
jgi:hypothetical protein